MIPYYRGVNGIDIYSLDFSEIGAQKLYFSFLEYLIILLCPGVREAIRLIYF